MIRKFLKASVFTFLTFASFKANSSSMEETRLASTGGSQKSTSPVIRSLHITEVASRDFKNAVQCALLSFFQAGEDGVWSKPFQIQREEGRSKFTEAMSRQETRKEEMEQLLGQLQPADKVVFDELICRIALRLTPYIITNGNEKRCFWAPLDVKTDDQLLHYAGMGFYNCILNSREDLTGFFANNDMDLSYAHHVLGSVDDEKPYSGNLNLRLLRGVKKIGDNFLYGSDIKGLDTYGLNDVEEFGKNFLSAFYQLKSIDSKHLKELRHCGLVAFSRCSRLTQFDFQNLSNLQSIGGEFFAYCRSLETVTFSIPDGLTAIPRGFFRDCKNLAYVNLTDGNAVTKIGPHFFSGCLNISQFTVFGLKNVRSIEQIETFLGGCQRILDIDCVSMPDSIPGLDERLATLCCGGGSGYYSPI